MKKFMYLGAAALAGLFATSCASDEPVAGTTDGMTTFTVQMPEDLTRTFGDATNANELYVAIYDASKKGEAPLFSNFAATDPNMSVERIGDTQEWTVKVNLVKNKQYELVFWAQNTSNAENWKNPYTFSATDRTISVKYDNIENYEDARDAFYKHVTYTSTTPAEQKITLTRAFAQINIGTAPSDLTAYLTAGGTNNFGMTISGASTVLNLSTDAVSGLSTEAVKIAAAPAPAPTATEANPAEALTVNGTAYDYLAMGYVLVGANGTNRDNLTVSLYNQEITETAEAFATYPNVPAQMNYRTNIFGNLLTNPEEFNVVIDNKFNQDDIEYPVANVSTEAELVAALQQTGTINLMSDITATSNADMKGNVIPANAKVNINLNGHNINTYGFTVEGNLTINGKGNVTQVNGTGDGLIWADKGNVVINGGNFKAGLDKVTNGATNSCVYATNNGTVTITGGEFSCTKAWTNGLWYVLNVNNDNPGIITVSGGTFYNFDPANGDDKLGGKHIKVAENYESVKIAENVWQVVAK